MNPSALPCLDDIGRVRSGAVRPEVTIVAGRQRRRDHAAIRRPPAFAAEIHHVRTDHQILHHEAAYLEHLPALFRRTNMIASDPRFRALLVVTQVLR